MSALVKIMLLTAAMAACAATSEPRLGDNLIARQALPAPPGPDEGDVPIRWADAEVTLTDAEAASMPVFYLANRLHAQGTLGRRLSDGRAAVVRCAALSPHPVHVRLSPSLDPKDAWAATTAAWSPRQHRAFAGPGWEQACQDSEGVLVDEGWVGEPWRVPAIQDAWSGARPWVNGFRVFLPGKAWVDAFAEVTKALALTGGDRTEAGLALLLNGSCHAALVGAEWVALAEPGASAIREKARAAIRSRVGEGRAEGARGQLLEVLATQRATGDPLQEAIGTRWRGAPIRTFPADVGRLLGELGPVVRTAINQMPVDPVAWGEACDAAP